MFTQKKKNYQTFLYVTIVATLCFLVLALLWPRETPKEQPVDLSSAALHKESEEEAKTPRSSDARQAEDDTENAEDTQLTENTENVKDSEEGEDEFFPEGPEGKEQKDNMPDPQASYYLVKHADGKIKVFFVSGDGSMIELEDTRIVYEVLGTEDQEHFDAGWRIDSQEDLAVLLQDFES